MLLLRQPGLAVATAPTAQAGGPAEPSTTENEFDFQDLDLGDLTVTSMQDTVALPETGGSSLCSCRGSCSSVVTV